MLDGLIREIRGVILLVNADICWMHCTGERISRENSRLTLAV